MGPTETPTESPTESPTTTPTKSPTESPTKTPTELPTEVPSRLSSESPTEIPTESPTESPTKTPTESPTESPTEGSACKDNGDFIFSYEADGKTVTSCAELTSELKKWAKIKTPCKKKFKFPDASGTKTVLSNICLLTCRNCPSASPTKVPSKLSSESPTETPTESPTESPTTTPTELPTKVPSKLSSESPTETPTTTPTGVPCADDDAFTFFYELGGVSVTSCAELTTKLGKASKIVKACNKKYKSPDATGTKTVLSEICFETCLNCPEGI